MMFYVGQIVQAIRDGGRSRDHLPLDIPIAGKYYRIAGIYEARYGLGCTLYDMDHAPFNGYFLLRNDNLYFEPVEALQPQEWWKEWNHDTTRTKGNDLSRPRKARR